MIGEDLKDASSFQRRLPVIGPLQGGSRFSRKPVHSRRPVSNIPNGGYGGEEKTNYATYNALSPQPGCWSSWCSTHRFSERGPAST